MLKEAVDVVAIMICKRHGNKLLYYWWTFQTCWLSLNHGSLARKVFGSLTIHFDRESTWSDIQETFIPVALWVYRIFLFSSQTSLTYYLIMAFKNFHLFASFTCRGQYALMLVMESVRLFLWGRENCKLQEILKQTHCWQAVHFMTLWLHKGYNTLPSICAVKEFFLHCMTLEDGTDMLSRNVSK
jgi:hypothetical protein